MPAMDRGGEGAFEPSVHCRMIDFHVQDSGAYWVQVDSLPPLEAVRLSSLRLGFRWAEGSMTI